MKKIKWHLLVLLIYSLLMSILDFFSFGMKIRILLEVDVLLRQFWVFYSGYAALHLFFISRKQKLGLFVFLFSLFGTYAFSIFYVFIRNVFYQETKYDYESLLYESLQSYTQFFIMSVGYFFFIRFKINQTENKLLLEKNLNLQKDLLQSENDFLRAQINPHFLYNSLNYFYAETFEALPNVGDSIMMLSDIMRYSLTDFKKTGDKAFLEDEVENIENIIKINKLRFGESLHINFIVEGDAAGKQIVPMMFITLVENMFKHGDLQDAAYPATITCKIDATTQKVTFITLNKRSKKVGDTIGGLGTKNIKKRLELLYGNDFTLDFVEEDIALYKATLIIPFTEIVTTQSA